MYGHEYRRGGFRFGWIPVVLGILLVVMLFSGGFHRLWFFAGPLCFGIPFFIAGAIAAVVAMRWRKYGAPHHNPGEFFGEFFGGEKAKRGEDDADAETYYV